MIRSFEKLFPLLMDFETTFVARPYLEFATSTCPWLPLSIVGLYMAFVLMVPRLMSSRRPFSLKNSLVIWNLTLSLFSFGGMSRTLPFILCVLSDFSFRETLCRLPVDFTDGVIGFWQMLFAFSKVLELMDTVFLVLRKRRVAFLHSYHHITVLLLCWYGFLHQSPINLYFMTMNYTVLTIMYSYYFLKTIDQWPVILSPMFITLLQILQMIGGTTICTMSFVYWLEDYGRCDNVQLNVLIASSIVYITYLYLFLDFFLVRFFTTKFD